MLLAQSIYSLHPTVVGPMNKESKMDSATGGISVNPLCYQLYITYLLEVLADLHLA
jgi:hypothetical protein